MFALLTALGVAAVVFAGAAFVPFIGVIGAILPALAALGVVYVLITRKVNQRVSAAMASVQAEMQKRNIDAAVTAMNALKAQYGKWIFLLSSQIDGQVGAVYFMTKAFDKARPFLEKAFVRQWDAKLMLAVLLSGQVGKAKGDMAAVDALLEKTARYTSKQGLLWSTWAWLWWKAGDSKKAVAILSRGKAVLGEADQNLVQNLQALQNDKKMKMKGYGDSWYALHLEVHPMQMQVQRSGNVRFARR